jgi:hypothetical protein
MALVKSGVSEERVASTIRVERMIELGTTLAVISNGSKLRRKYFIMSTLQGILL